MTKKKPAADAGMAALLEAETARVRKERAEFEAKWKPFARKPIVANEDSLVKTVHEIAEVAGVDSMSAEQVKNVAEFVSTGRLWLEGGKIMYRLRRAVKVGQSDEVLKDFELREIPDKEMESLGVDGFRVGMLIATGQRQDVDKNDIRKIARGAIRLPEAKAEFLPLREIMAIYALYTLFFLGQ